MQLFYAYAIHYTMHTIWCNILLSIIILCLITGVCCIDELDKIDCDYHALLEAMEQVRICVAYVYGILLRNIQYIQL